MPALRVAFDGRSLSSPVTRGWDHYAIGLVGALVRRGVEVTLFHRAGQPLHGPHVESLGCRVQGLKARFGIQYEQVVVPWAVARGGFDLFHAPFENGVPLVCSRPVALTVHSATGHSYLDLTARGLLPGRAADYLGYEPGKTTWQSRYQAIQPSRASHVFTPSEFSREEIVRLMNVAPDKVTTTPLAVHARFRQPRRSDEHRAATRARLGVSRPFLLFVGGYEPHKNIPGLLRAFARARTSRPDLMLVLVGTKVLPEAVVRDADALGLARGRDVVFLVNLTDELVDLYDDAEMLVTLSWRESFCLPALEAMTRGTPVVASSWGATPEVVGGAGRLVDPRDAEAAGEAILELLQPDQHARCSALALQRASAYNWDHTAELTLAAYHRLVGRGHVAAR